MLIAYLIFDLDKLEDQEKRIVTVPIILGTVSLVFGYDMTGSGFMARGHCVNQGTPGCVWIALGIICWAFAILFYFAGEGIRSIPEKVFPSPRVHSMNDSIFSKTDSSCFSGNQHRAYLFLYRWLLYL